MASPVCLKGHHHLCPMIEPGPKPHVGGPVNDVQVRDPRFATDALMNRMVRHLGYPGQEETDHLLWPEAYAPLYECFKIHESYRARQFADFMKSWYRRMKETYWYDSHKAKHDVYFGYWCFEAAAVAKMLDIDDSGLKDHPNYPYDTRHG